MIWLVVALRASAIWTDGNQPQNPDIIPKTSNLGIGARNQGQISAKNTGHISSGVESKPLVIVRTYNPSDHMIERMARIESECLRSGREFFIGLDHHPDEPWRIVDSGVSLQAQRFEEWTIFQDIKRLNYHGGMNLFHSLNFSDSSWIPIFSNAANSTVDLISTRLDGVRNMINRFPNRVIIYSDNVISTFFPSIKLMPKARNSYSYNFHEESIYVLLRQYEERIGGEWKGSHLWVIEDDLEYTGHWNMLLDKYFLRNFDLVSWGIEKARTWDDFHYAHYCNDLFKAKYESCLQHHGEHIVFYSRRFRLEIDAVVANRIHCHSELLTPTICNSSSHCVHGSLEDGDVDKEYMSFLAKHERQEYESRVAQLYRENVAKLLHPCKF